MPEHKNIVTMALTCSWEKMTMNTSAAFPPFPKGKASVNESHD
jgi:hypothetical protein